MEKLFANKVAFITGGAAGMGLAAVKAFAEEAQQFPSWTITGALRRLLLTSNFAGLMFFSDAREAGDRHSPVMSGTIPEVANMAVRIDDSGLFPVRRSVAHKFHLFSGVMASI